MIKYDTENNLLTSRQTEAFTHITYEMSGENLYSKKAPEIWSNGTKTFVWAKPFVMNGTESEAEIPVAI